MKFLEFRESAKGHKMALYICEYCNNETIKRVSGVNKGKIKSCGCLKIKKLKARATHYMSNTKIYKTWHEMFRRCTNKKHHAYERYGARGISVCKEWEDPLIFKEWALNNGYDSNLQIDRINNDGNYEPSNCRFVTAKDNMRNNSHTKLTVDIAKEIKAMLDFGEKQVTIAKKFNVHQSSISNIKRKIAWL